MRRIILGLAIVVAVAACADGAADPEPTALDQTPAGFALSPPSFDAGGLEAFFDLTEESGSALAWVGPWTDLGEGGALIATIAADRDLTPVVVTGFAPEQDGTRVIPADGDAVVDAIVVFLEEHRVPFLGFGVEVNVAHHEAAGGDFDRFVDLFERVASAVEDVSPDTVVFPGFQLERLRGLGGGLFGDEPPPPAWELIDRFDSADAIGFTTYPGLIFESPTAIPDDYYTDVAERVELPIVFTEIGWQAGGDLGAWSGTPQRQADFLSQWLPELEDTADLLIWSFLWDQPQAPGAFATMGLVAADGSQRPALDVWQDRFGR